MAAQISSKSIIDQIYEQTFEKIDENDLFDEKLVKKIKVLAENGGLKKSETVVHTLIQSQLVSE